MPCSRVCAVSGCLNTANKLEKWRETTCAQHGIPQANCVCVQPYRLLTFPTQKKEPELREQWTKQINRKDPYNSSKRWEPKNDSRICSIHFMPGGTIPTLHLSYKTKVIKERNRPTADRRAAKQLHTTTPKRQHVAGTDSQSSCTTTEASARLPPQRSDTLPVSPPSPPPASLPSTIPVRLTASAAHKIQGTGELSEAVLNADEPPSPPGSAISPLSNSSPQVTPELPPSTDHDYEEGHACEDKDDLLRQLKAKIIRLEAALEAKQHRKAGTVPDFHTFIKSDKAVRQNTGFPNICSLQKVFDGIAKKANGMRYWKGEKKIVVSSRVIKKFGTPKKPGPKRKLPLKAEFVMTMMKLRQGLSNELLASLFGISVSTCSITVNTWVKFLAREMRSLVHWPDVFATRQAMPADLKAKYPKLRCTMDCTEIFIERPNDLELQALTWSNYKNHNTVKCLVCITPDGMVSFLSDAWGGRASDQLITRESDVLDRLDRGDTVLADRGFTIREDLLLRGVNHLQQLVWTKCHKLMCRKLRKSLMPESMWKGQLVD